MGIASNPVVGYAVADNPVAGYAIANNWDTNYSFVSDRDAGYGGDFGKYACPLYVSVNMLAHVVCFGYWFQLFISHLLGDLIRLKLQ
jgi:hypothetical protein